MKWLEIAAGSDYNTWVQDVRTDTRWADPTWQAVVPEHRMMFVHHTALNYYGTDVHAEWDYMIRIRDHAPFGLPYNFLVFPREPFRIYYLNDVDVAYPHTYAHNNDVAIAAAGNYDEQYPPAGLVNQIARLSNALAVMWNRPLMPLLGHRDVSATACPGQHLYAALGLPYR